MKKITSSAQCRIDLAGGTIDLWPLYLYFGGTTVVNMAIDTKAFCRIECAPSKTWEIWIESNDLNTKSRFDSIEELEESLKKPSSLNPLRWVNRVVHHYLKNSKFKKSKLMITTWSETPPGSGLGGSSVLGIAMAKALHKLTGKSLDKWETQQVIRDLECVEIEHPAGDQDYVPALFGGLIKFDLGTNSRSVKKLPAKSQSEIQNKVALLYTGKPHHSGINNWQVFKALHDGDKELKAKLEAISSTSESIGLALEKGAFKEIPTLINQEWEIRKTLAPAVDAPVFSEAWKWAQKLGAVARKGCGSGGGGCMFFYFKTKAERNAALKKPLPNNKWKWLKV